MFIDIHAHAYLFDSPPQDGRTIFCKAEEVLRRYDELGIEKGVLLPLIGPETYLAQSNQEILEICRVIESFDYMDHVTFIAGNVQNLLYVRKHYPDQPAQVVAWKLTDELLDTLTAHRLDLDVCYKDLTKEQIELLHTKGLKVNCWTVNDVETAERLIAWGIDMITSNILE